MSTRTSRRTSRRTSVAMFVAVLLGFSGLGYGVARAVDGIAPTAHDEVVQVKDVGLPETDPTPATPTATPVRKPARTLTPKPTPTATPTRKPAPTPAPTPTPTPEPEPTAGPPLLQPGDRGPEVRELQARLRQIDWFSGNVTDLYGPVTTESVRGFQAKRGIAVTGYVDQETLDRLHAMTREPTRAELQNQVAPTDNVAGKLDPRCATGHALCIDKSTRTLRWVVDGTVRRTVDVRFGSSYTPTREGAFQVEWKSRDHVSSLYDSSMPFAMFFSGGQAVHYSPDFAANGYSGASHGCVNVRDYAAVKALFDEVSIGDKVIVYWS